MHNRPDKGDALEENGSGERKRWPQSPTRKKKAEPPRMAAVSIKEIDLRYRGIKLPSDQAGLVRAEPCWLHGVEDTVSPVHKVIIHSTQPAMPSLSIAYPGRAMASVQMIASSPGRELGRLDADHRVTNARLGPLDTGKLVGMSLETGRLHSIDVYSATTSAWTIDRTRGLHGRPRGEQRVKG